MRHLLKVLFLSGSGTNTPSGGLVRTSYIAARGMNQDGGRGQHACDHRNISSCQLVKNAYIYLGCTEIKFPSYTTHGTARKSKFLS